MSAFSNLRMSGRNQVSLAFLALLTTVVFYQYSTQRFDVPSVNVDEGRTLIDQGATVVDVRGSQAFGNRHIAGALSLPLEILRSGVPTSFAVPKDKAILVYCGDGVTNGPEGTAILRNAGYAKAVNLEPGIEGWVAAGQAVEK